MSVQSGLIGCLSICFTLKSKQCVTVYLGIIEQSVIIDNDTLLYYLNQEEGDGSGLNKYGHSGCRLSQYIMNGQYKYKISVGYFIDIERTYKIRNAILKFIVKSMIFLRDKSASISCPAEAV